jgi:hypothetical protein
MRQRPFLRLAHLGSAVVLSGLLTCAHAVELGDALVRSHIGQPLSADIELTGIVNDAATVQVGLADPDVYRGANISMHPAVASLNITIVRREGKRFLHLKSAKVVESDFVHIFFELNENGRRAVRQATLWFTPDPNPAPPKPAPVAAAAAPAAVPAPPPALVPAKPPVAAPVPPRVAAAPVIPPIVPALKAAPMLRAAPPAACVQQFTAAQIGTCTALDAKNAALSAQIVELEEKVRRLTVAMNAGAAPAAPVRPVVKPLPEKLAPMGAPVSKPAGATPWPFIGIASALVFALVGVLLYLLQRKRKAARKPVPKAGAGFIASVKNRLLPGRKNAEPPEAVEPTAG